MGRGVGPRKRIEDIDVIKDGIAKKILDILEIHGEYNKFMLNELDANEEKQKAIIGLTDEIREVYGSNEMSFLIPSKKYKRPYFSIINLILKDRGYILINKSVCVKVDDRYKQFKQWSVFLPQQIN
jgi:hypothetical protein